MSDYINQYQNQGPESSLSSLFVTIIDKLKEQQREMQCLICIIPKFNLNSIKADRVLEEVNLRTFIKSS